MNVRTMGELFREELGQAEITVPGRTGLHVVACDNLTMSRAYLTDGDAFFSSGDPVNALAAYCYGEGWLHCGSACGFVAVTSPRCMFRNPIEPLAEDTREKLIEKTGRYDRLIATARAAVRVAPESGTAPFSIAEWVELVSAAYAGQGTAFLARREFENALACFSYGHGWLDAGVRAGLYIVTSDRDLFTI